MATLAELNKKRWDNCKVPATMGPKFQRVAQSLSSPEAQLRYKAVEKTTGVPWWFIAVVHQREASQNWNTYLGNGQTLNKKTTIVPKGRGPFKTWEEGAVDALTNCAPFAAQNKDWSIGGALAMLEKYNGLGYYNKGVPSPYIWAGTNQYTKGKYVRDGVYDPNHVDTQLGCAGLLKFMGIFPKTGAVVAGTAAGAGTAAYVATYWDHIMHHWVAYGLGTAITLGFICLMVYAYKHKDDVVV